LDDQDLVARIRTGDLEAASALLSRYQDVAYTVALRLLGQPSDAEDLAQEALVRAYTHLSELQQGASFSGWLRRITVNLSLNALRRRGQLQFESLDAERRGDGTAMREVSDTSQPTPEHAALASELRAEVDTLLRELPAEQRVAVVLRDMYGYDVAAIAELQHCGVSAAKMRIVRGRSLLRRLLIEARASSDDTGY
jgi:RNA polymerase sigma-70 factor (ECF subfamily)